MTTHRKAAADNQPIDEFDFIVVGSGAGGGPLAARLALAGFSVLVLEAGDDHQCLYYSIPIMQAYASEDENMRWDFFVRHWDDEATQQRDTKYAADQGGILYPRGATVGGSTAVSAMVTMYPHARDWTALAELTGDPSWGPEAMRNRFRKLETWRGVDAEPLPGQDESERDLLAAHGYDGWLGTTRAAPSVGGREPMFLDIIAAIEQTSRELFGIAEDVSLPRDYNAADTPQDFEGMSFIPVAVAHSHRNGARERVQDIAEQRPDKLEIRTNALATRVLIEDRRAVGVEYLLGSGLYAASPLPANQASTTHVVRARREVIMAAGAFNTPQLLMLSGIGPAEHLREHQIDVILDAPGVGANLHDRYEVSVESELEHDYPIFEGSTLDIPDDPHNADDLFAEWRDSGDGPYSTNGSLAALIAKSGAATDASDLIIFALPVEFVGYYPGYSHDSTQHHNRLSVLVLKGHSTNRAGTVRLRSNDPRDMPDIRFRYFTEGDGNPRADLDGIVDGVKIARQIVEHLQTPVLREIVPGPNVTDDDALREFVATQAWGHHACGTAKIGASDDPTAVLDGDFRVRGIDGLRVVDASVFPDIPGFFICSAVYLISEKAAETIVAHHTR